MEGAPRPLDPGKENAILNPLQLPQGEGEANGCMGLGFNGVLVRYSESL
jgi:hypothetical protein